jgi:DNA-binding PadR family transcriptional regulator
LTQVAAEHALDTVDYWKALYRKSLLRFFLLGELAKRPMHGYEIGSFVAVCCDWKRPADAMIYPTLRELEEGGYIVCEVEEVSGRQRKVCRLTDRGRSAYEAAAKAWALALPQIEIAVRAAGVEPTCCTGDEVCSAQATPNGHLRKDRRT